MLQSVGFPAVHETPLSRACMNSPRRPGLRSGSRVQPATSTGENAGRDPYRGGGGCGSRRRPGRGRSRLPVVRARPLSRRVQRGQPPAMAGGYHGAHGTIRRARCGVMLKLSTQLRSRRVSSPSPPTHPAAGALTRLRALTTCSWNVYGFKAVP